MDSASGRLAGQDVDDFGRGGERRSYDVSYRPGDTERPNVDPFYRTAEETHVPTVHASNTRPWELDHNSTPRLATSPQQSSRPWDRHPTDGGPGPSINTSNEYSRHSATPRNMAHTLPSPTTHHNYVSSTAHHPSNGNPTLLNGSISPSFYPVHNTARLPSPQMATHGYQSFDLNAPMQDQPPRLPDEHASPAHQHIRPGSMPWNFAYGPGDHHSRPPLPEFQADAYGTAAPRAINPSLPPPIPPPYRGFHDHADPFIGDRGTGFVSSVSPRDYPPLSAPSGGHTLRRTSLESGTNSRKPPTTNRLGLDPVAKQERRREQNRLAQRAFRARAKQKQDKGDLSRSIE